MIVKAACIVTIPNIAESKIIPLHRHGDIGKIFSAFGYKPGECKIVEQGFIDNLGNFYNRADALKEALRCNQISASAVKHKQLFSEDLY